MTTSSQTSQLPPKKHLAADSSPDTKPIAPMNLIHKAGSTDAIKAYKSDDGKTGWVEGYLVSWGGNGDTDLQGEYFTPRTEFCLDWFADRPVLYHHGLDGEAGLRKIGKIKTVETDDLGLWVQAQLDLRDRYASAVYDMVKSKEFGWSSGSVDHLVKIASNGEIATWPLIEGSITPTPAQPSKTSVRVFKSADLQTPNTEYTASYRAFKAVLSHDDAATDYLRGLEARVSGLASANGRMKTIVNENQTSPSEASAKRLARKFAHAAGVRLNSVQLDQVAAKMEAEVDDMVASAAAEELEMEAALSSLEQEMVIEPEETIKMTTRNSRTNARPSARRNVNPRGYRNEDLTDQLATQMEDQFSVQMDDIAAQMADELAAQMEDELSLQAEEAQLTKAIALRAKRKALKQALKNLTATDDVEADFNNAADFDEGGEGLGLEGSSYLGEANDNAKSIRRQQALRKLQAQRNANARRGVARRTFGEDQPIPVQGDDEAFLSDDEVELEEVARRAYSNGFRKGMRRAFRTSEADSKAGATDLLDIKENNGEPGNYEGVPQGAADITAPKSLQRARRALQQMQAKRGFRNSELGGDELAAMSEEVAAMADELVAMGDPTAAQSARSLRRARRALQAAKARATTGRSYRNTDELPVATDEEALMGDDEVAQELKAARAFRKGYTQTMSRARRNFGEEPVMTDEEAFLSDEEAFLSDEEAFLSDEDVATVASYRSVNRRGNSGYNVGAGRNARAKSATTGFSQYDYDKQAEYWKNKAEEATRRAVKAEQMEAPGQRGFKSVSVTRDQADQPGAYSNAFKSYLYNGISMMNDDEKRTLKGKGQVAWNGVKSTDMRNVDPRAKAYFGGSDSSVGFAVPPDWVAELNKNIMTQTVMAAECRTRTTNSDRIIQTNKITNDARRSGQAEVRWPGEVITNPSAVHRTAESQYSQVDIPIHVMMISLTAGNSALEDVSFSLEDEINTEFSEAVAVAYDTLIWGGDGQGKMQGIVVNEQVAGHRSANLQTVGGYVPTGSVDGIMTADTLKEMLYHLPRGYRQRAKWYMNGNTGLMISTLKDGEGNYLIDQRDSSLQEAGVPERLLGRPIIYNDYADDPEAGNFPIILGDLSKGYMIGKRVDFSIRRFDDASYAELDQVLFLGRARLGGQVLQPAAMKLLKIAIA